MSNVTKIDDWRRRAGHTVRNAQEILDASRTTVWRRIKSGELETFHLGRAIRIKTESLIRVIDGEAA
ncbi:MAG: helix-turn-helix domain-containing protein [Methylovirgula sp.]|uniref:helix-turn-helix domain-containing protein n=1 Tax=Methylovirgula sp. TaxID=1978224 RepID=UPI0030765823